MRRLVVIALCTWSALSLASDKKRPAALMKQVTLEKDIQPFFDVACVSCHIPGVANGNMILEQGDSYAALVGVKATGAKDQVRVVPGKPDESYLLRKLKGTHKEVNGNGERMPMGGNAVPDATIALIVKWIEGGAVEK